MSYLSFNYKNLVNGEINLGDVISISHNSNYKHFINFLCLKKQKNSSLLINGKTIKKDKKLFKNYKQNIHIYSYNFDLPSNIKIIELASILKFDEKEINNYFKKFNLLKYKDSSFNQINTDEQKKLTLALSFCYDSKIFIIDGYDNFDEITKKLILKLSEKRKKEKKITIIITDEKIGDKTLNLNTYTITENIRKSEKNEKKKPVIKKYTKKNKNK